MRRMVNGNIIMFHGDKCSRACDYRSKEDFCNFYKKIITYGKRVKECMDDRSNMPTSWSGK